MLIAFAICFARMNKNQESDDAVDAMWKNCIAHDPHWGRHLRYKTVLRFLSMPGKFGRWFTNTIYAIGNSIVRYN